MSDSKAYITTPQFPFHVESIHGAKAFPFEAPNHDDGEILFAAEIQIEYHFMSHPTPRLRIGYHFGLLIFVDKRKSCQMRIAKKLALTEKKILLLFIHSTHKRTCFLIL